MINFQTIDITMPTIKTVEVINWLERVVDSYSKKTGEVFFLFCTDEYLYELNVKYLQHDTFTDIITFDNSESADVISGELFISLDRVAENAQKLSGSFERELFRVLVHGLLHLIGFNDKSIEEGTEMRLQENICLSLLPGNI